LKKTYKRLRSQGPKGEELKNDVKFRELNLEKCSSACTHTLKDEGVGERRQKDFSKSP